LQKVFHPSDLADDAKRAEMTPKILPIVTKITTLADELAGVGDPVGKEQGAQIRGQFMSFRVMLGDKQAADELEAQVKSKDAAESTAAKGQLLAAHWLLAHKDVAAQKALADQAAELAKANPTDNSLTASLLAMTQMGSSSHEITNRLEDMILGMKSAAAGMMRPMIEAHRKVAALENKPLVIKGVKNGGGDFTTDAWKGKVVMVDFWATWCQPCMQALPRVKKAYSTFHDKGLEIVGVSCDEDADALNKFLKSNPDMPWPQLFDPKMAGWNPIATELNVSSIPTMFLIDKKGILRTVDAGDDFEEQIAKLLEEK